MYFESTQIIILALAQYNATASASACTQGMCSREIWYVTCTTDVIQTKVPSILLYVLDNLPNTTFTTCIPIQKTLTILILLEVQQTPVLCSSTRDDEKTTQLLPETTFNADSLDNNFPVLELDGSPNSVEEVLIKETMSYTEHKDNVDILVPSLSIYSRSAKSVSAIQTVMKCKSFHETPIYKPFIVDV